MLFHLNLFMHNAALSGGAVCWDAKRHLQTVTSRSSALVRRLLYELRLIKFRASLFQRPINFILFGADKGRSER